MIFNKNDKGSEELQQLTGNYYANNNFAKIQMDIQLEEESLIQLVGRDVYDRAVAHYLSGNFQKAEPSDTEKLDDQLVQHIQLPVAMLATFRFYQANIVSHEDSGRKIKIDSQSEKLPWEWMYDRDDRANLRKAYSAIDRLINFLEENTISEWTGSDSRKKARSLFVNSTQMFNDVFPIDGSPRFFYTVLPFNAEVQRKLIKPALGSSKYQELLEYFQANGEPNGSLEDLLGLVQEAIPLLTMVTAVKRLSVQVLPEGVVQQFNSETQSRKANRPAPDEAIRRWVIGVEKDAQKALDEIKRLLKSQTPDALNYQLLPSNDCSQKIFRT